MDTIIKNICLAIAVSTLYLGCTQMVAADPVSIFDGDFYAELGAGYSTSFFQDNDDYKWENGNSPGFYGSLRYELMLDRDRLGVVLHYTHHSNWLVGPPFNDDAESSLDHIGIAVRWKLTNR